ncbi:MAG: cyclic nucleotide-binding domain-containing protein [Spirochaetales bacterium]|nr:cyclic nucleotide-binding domain-containing protein [Spirochaetales bacterium]
MIHLESKIKMNWDLSVLIISIGAALIIPISVVFETTQRFLPLFATIISTGAFITDIILSFNTSFHFQGKIIQNRRAIAQRYLKSWFAIDLIAALPIGIILSLISSPQESGVQLLRVLALVKLFRIARTMQRIGGRNINPAILRLFLLVFWILLAAHIVSCGWMYIRSYSEEMNPGDRYIDAFYWTITTLTTIGYGDRTPIGRIEILYVILIEILGAGMYGLVIGNIANLIANIDVAKTQYKEKLDKINTFLKYRNIPYNLQNKINNYYNYLWESRRGYDESSVLGDLPDPLKESVSLFLNKDIIEKVPIFEAASEDLIKDVIMNMEPVVFTPGDYIVRAGEVGFDMYFISRGRVDVVSADEKTNYAVLAAGQFFGEIALLLSMPRTATIKAKEYCDLYRLDKETFDRILTRYPDFNESMQELAETRKAENEARGGAAPGVAKASTVKTANAPPGEIETIQVVKEDTRTNLTWSAVENAENYEVIRKTPDADRWQFLFTKLTETACADENLGEPVYLYRVRAVNSGGAGPWTAYLSVEIPR